MDFSSRARQAGVSLDDTLRLLDAQAALARVGDAAVLARRTCELARGLIEADGASFVLSEGAHVFYVEEDVPGALWRGRRFPVGECISGWAIRHRRPAVVTDAARDARVPWVLYQPTGVKSLAMMPMGGAEACRGAIGLYWSREHTASARELFLLEVLAEAAASALAHAEASPRAEGPRADGSSPSLGAPPLRWLLPVLLRDMTPPLDTILLGARALLLGGELGTEELRQVEHILSGVARARHQVDQALAYASRHVREGLRLAVSPTRMDVLARHVVDAAREAFPHRRVEFVAQEVLGAWDASRMAEALQHLVRGALQRGSPEHPVTLRVEARPSESYVEVHSEGCLLYTSPSPRDS